MWYTIVGMNALGLDRPEVTPLERERDPSVKAEARPLGVGGGHISPSIAISSVKRKDKEIDEDPAFREALRKALAEESTPLTRKELRALVLGE